MIEEDTVAGLHQRIQTQTQTQTHTCTQTHTRVLACLAIGWQPPLLDGAQKRQHHACVHGACAGVEEEVLREVLLGKLHRAGGRLKPGLGAGVPGRSTTRAQLWIIDSSAPFLKRCVTLTKPCSAGIAV